MLLANINHTCSGRWANNARLSAPQLAHMNRTQKVPICTSDWVTEQLLVRPQTPTFCKSRDGIPHMLHSSYLIPNIGLYESIPVKKGHLFQPDGTCVRLRGNQLPFDELLRSDEGNWTCSTIVSGPTHNGNISMYNLTIRYM